MSRRSSNPAKSPTPDIYVSLLVVSVAALAIGCIFLALELNAYDWMLAP